MKSAARSALDASVHTAGALLAGWRTVVAWPGATWHELALVSLPGAGGGGRGVPLVRVALPGGRRRALLIAGTHGDESGGPRALRRFFASGAAGARRGAWSFDVLPLVNPLGFDRGTRGRPGCPDLNRAFGAPPACPETAAILAYVGAAAPRLPQVPRWELALSLHEDPEAGCLYCYDSGDRERHRLAAALHEATGFLDWTAANGTPVCEADEVEGAPNRGGVLIAAQEPFPALEPLLFRTHRARRVVTVEAPGQAAAPQRERLHLAAPRHYLPAGRRRRGDSVGPGAASGHRVRT